MPTSEGIRVAKTKGLELYLVDFRSEPPVCQISDSNSFDSAPPFLDGSQGYSFDPTIRPATIQFSSTVADEDLERKIDILRKHLLEKKRCEVVITNKDDRSDTEDIQFLLTRILTEVKDIAKLAESPQLEEIRGSVRARVWPCSPEQADESFIPRLEVDESGSNPSLKPDGHERKFRHVRPRLDPKIQNLIKHPKKKLEDMEE